MFRIGLYMGKVEIRLEVPDPDYEIKMTTYIYSESIKEHAHYISRKQIQYSDENSKNLIVREE